MSKKWFFLLPIIALVFGVAGAAYFQIIDPSFLWKEKETELAGGEGDLPPALGRHLQELQKTIPGNGGESPEGPGGAGEQKLYALAYPAKDIDLRHLQGMRATFANIKARSASSPRGGGPTWESYGPTIAKVPDFGPRDATLYTPKKYFASGRVTNLAIASTCTKQQCRLWLSAAGGGVWRTDNALAKNPTWTYLSGIFEINAIGSITVDPNDATGNTIWVGTGEGNASGDSAFGVGIYKSTDGGDSWTGPLGKTTFNGRAVGSIAVKTGDSNIVYAGVVRAVNGVASVAGGGTTILVPNAPIWGLYKSTDGGTTWALIHNGAPNTTGCTDPATVATNATQCSPRGVRQVALDPSDPTIVYASSFSRGIWRSPDEGATFAQIFTPLSSAVTTDRSQFATTLLAGGATRMYVGEGHTGAGGQYSRLFRSDDVRTASPVFTDLTSNDPANPGYGSFDYCTGQCWYDNTVVTPAGFPDIVYLAGSFQYNENDPPFPPAGDNTDWISNGRGLVYSTDAGVSFNDFSYDGTDFLHPFGIHPDFHAVVTNPNNPLQFFEAGDGGVVRSNGQVVNRSNFCNPRGLSGANLTRCQQLLSSIPDKIVSINKGLHTLQFQSLSVSPFNSNDVQGGTQDNGTWEIKKKNPEKWNNTMIGDGGQSGFDIGNKNFRFHTFFLGQLDVNFSAGDVADWNWTSDPWFIAGEAGASSFYIPVIHDPTVSKTLYAGLLSAWRTQTYGMGSFSINQMRQICNEWTGDFSQICGDWEILGTTTLTDAALGDRSGGFVTAVERTKFDNSTLWAATSTGRVFVSANADAVPASSVAFTRIDGLSTADPARFVAGIWVSSTDPNQALIVYSGFSANTPLEPGHIFQVDYDPIGATATWTSLDGAGPGSLGDIPLNDVVVDDATGDIYAANDFGVMLEPAAAGINWQLAAPGMPNVETPGLTIDSAERVLYAATHGRGAWRLDLP